MLQDISLYIHLFEKGALLLAGVIYLIFAAVVVKQVGTMAKNVNDKFNYVLIIFSYLHLAFTLVLIFLTLTLL